jgi:predicted short-subunit dehydrogenase-like oxidoreductase (DUF2520 family)
MLPKNCYIAGTGNLALALGEHIQSNKDFVFKGWLSRNPSAAGINPVCAYDVEFEQDDWVFLCVPDRFISDVATTLSGKGAKLIHCSGATALHAGIDAVWWPMQTFSKEISSVWQQVPVFIESPDEKLRKGLIHLAETTGGVPIIADSETRNAAHVAAVVANNFSNAMYVFAGNILEEHGLSPALLKPIIKQTAEKVQAFSPAEVQTGPAIRNDQAVIEGHLELLKKQPVLQQLYKQISAAIQFLFK